MAKEQGVLEVSGHLRRWSQGMLTLRALPIPKIFLKKKNLLLINSKKKSP
jgi:hypothetical protein